MSQSENNYLNLMTEILEDGTLKPNRTGTDTLDLFGRQLRFDLRKGFPLLTTKKMFTKAVFVELLWFLRGETNIKFLHDHDVHIWDEWADTNGDLGPVYAKQWRAFGGIAARAPQSSTPHAGRGGVDQVAQLVFGLRENPASRRHIVSAWDPRDVPHMALPPCHLMFQCDVTEGRLSLHMYQRSADYFLGVPFNIASYALLTHMLAQVTGLEVGDLVISYGSVHLYVNHLDQAREQLRRMPRDLPTLLLDPRVKEIDNFVLNDIKLADYTPHPAIKAAVAV